MNKIEVGKIVNTQGLKGEVRVYPYTSYKERFEEMKYIYMGEDLEKVEITRVYYKKNMVILKLKGYNSISEVEGLKDRMLYTERRELPEDEFYIRDLIGLVAYDGDVVIGKVKDVLTDRVQDLYVIEKEGGGEVLIPAVDAFLKDIDLEGGKIVFSLIEGMLE